MTDSPPVYVTHADHGAQVVTLNRPDAHNAFDQTMIAWLGRILAKLAADPTVRTVMLAAQGAHVSAGTEPDELRRLAGLPFEDALEETRALAGVLRILDTLPRPTVALVHGVVSGPAVGLVACCDMVICADDATFSLPEVRQGLVPSVVLPYVVAAIGARATRRYGLTAEKFDAEMALHLGLVHEVVARDDLDGAAAHLAHVLARNGPAAMAEAKARIRALRGRAFDEALGEEAARHAARIIATDEAREGMRAVAEKRKPAWCGERS